MLPSLHALSLRAVASSTGAGTPRLMPNATPDVLSDLPPELIEMLIKIIDRPNPCHEVVKLCELSREWLGRCRSGWMYDAANRALGYYGAQKTWEGVQQHYEAISGAVPPKTPKEYFQAACLARFDSSATNVTRYHPFYEVRLLQQIRTTGHPLLESISVDFSDYDAANRALGYYGVQKTWEAVLALYRANGAPQEDWTPKEYFEAVRRIHFDYRSRPWTRYHPFFEARLLYQMQNAAYNWKTPQRPGWRLRSNDQSEILQYVPTDLANYGEIAKLAVQRWMYALQYVPTDLANYDAIAKVAVRTNPYALQWVPKDLADYGAIAELAAQRAWAKAGKDLSNMARHLQELPDFVAIAKVAVKEDGMVLKDVPTDRDYYGAIARLALKENGDALEYVPEDRDDYGVLAKLAVMKDGRALRYVPKDRADYEELAELAAAALDVPVGELDAVLAAYAAIAELAAQRAWAKAGKDLTNTHIQELPDFGAIAKIAVKEDGMALKDVPTDHYDYGAIARLALKENGDALEYVPEDRDDYGVLAKLAVMKDVRALRYVPKDCADYEELAELAAAALDVPVGELDAVLAATFDS